MEPGDKSSSSDSEPAQSMQGFRPVIRCSLGSAREDRHDQDQQPFGAQNGRGVPSLCIYEGISYCRSYSGWDTLVRYLIL